jgi:hypothetical protein
MSTPGEINAGRTQIWSTRRGSEPLEGNPPKARVNRFATANQPWPQGRGGAGSDNRTTSLSRRLCGLFLRTGYP